MMQFMLIRKKEQSAIITDGETKPLPKHSVEIPLPVGEFVTGRKMDAAEIKAMKALRAKQITDFKYEGASRHKKSKPLSVKPRR